MCPVCDDVWLTREREWERERERINSETDHQHTHWLSVKWATRPFTVLAEPALVVAKIHKNTFTERRVLLLLLRVIKSILWILSTIIGVRVLNVSHPCVRCECSGEKTMIDRHIESERERNKTHSIETLWVCVGWVMTRDAGFFPLRHHSSVNCNGVILWCADDSAAHAAGHRLFYQADTLLPFPCVILSF